MGLVALLFGRWWMKRQIRPKLEILGDLNSDLTGSAEQVASSTKEIIVASNEQLETLNSTVTASHEIRSMIERTCDSTESLRSQASQLLELAQSGNQTVDAMVRSSQEVRAEMESFNREMTQSMAQLAEALGVIREIAAKTEVINTIVFQTKLLSFNASVEAARAGEAGKGFSVVAEEVGKLAELSGGAANEISGIVERSVRVANEAIESTRNKIEALTRQSVKTSEAGYHQAKTCEGVFHQMAGKIKETSSMVEHISLATNDQAQGVTKLDESIHAFQEAAHRNRLIASQGTEHAREFQSQTRALSELVGVCSQLLGAAGQTARRLKKFVWNDRLALGAPEMDDEHKILIEKINTLVETLQREEGRQNPEKLLPPFQDLAAYTLEHFSHEEKFMESIGYPQLDSHKKIHRKLLEQVGSFGEDIKNRRLDDVKLVSFLNNWLLSHIMGVDMQYAKHYKEHRPAGASRRAA